MPNRRSRKLPKIVLDPREAACLANLQYVSDQQPGYRRIPAKDGFAYLDEAGKRIRKQAILDRIRKLAIPPAYTSVWICPDPDGHLQAVGRDARGRKQYRYHPQWRTVRDENKYGKMLMFGRVLPAIRARVAEDLALRDLPKRKVVAAIVALLERTLMRVGNEEYAKDNKSYGLTTLRNRHVKISGRRVAFDFRGKHGIAHHIELDDPRLTRVVARCRDLPGQELFQYVDEEGERRPVTSTDVNEYLREITGEEITAKDFRTWAATNLAAALLSDLQRFDSQAATKKNVLQTVEQVAKRLGNTPAICRKCYIHPAVFEGYLDGSLAEALKQRAEEVLEQPGLGLSAPEVALTAYLSRRLEQGLPSATA